MSDNKLLDIVNLTVKYKTKVREITALNKINLSMKESEIVAIVGESGCGKSTLGLSIINLLQRPPALIHSGEILFNGVDLLKLKESQLSELRGTSISMIFQDPMSSLDPVYRVGYQISEAIGVRERRGRRSYGPFDATDPNLRKGADGGMNRVLGAQIPRSRRTFVYSEEAEDALRRVQISDPDRVLDKYPFELSGGIAQRVMIAQTLIEKPTLLIADEPTSALDVTTQAQVLSLMRALRDEIRSSIIFITHDLAVAAQVADRVGVMYAGEIVEIAGVKDIFGKPQHPYTEGLINSFPSRYKDDEGRLESIPGDVPDLRDPPLACRFNPRCKYAFDRCRIEHPELIQVTTSDSTACFLRYPG